MDATVDLNYYPRPAESHRQRDSKRFKVLCKLPPTFAFSLPATDASLATIAVTKQILCLPRVLENVRGSLRGGNQDTSIRIQSGRVRLEK